MTFVLGLDVSARRLGWALCDAETANAYSCGYEAISDTCPGDDLRRHLKSLRWTNFQQIIAVYIEGAHVGLNHGGSIAHAMTIGRALQQAETVWHMAAVQIIEPATWRKLVGLKGNASKAEVATWARGYGFEHTIQDALDAGGIAVAGQIRNLEVIAASQ